jgi:hypothetical protein
MGGMLGLLTETHWLATKRSVIVTCTTNCDGGNAIQITGKKNNGL